MTELADTTAVDLAAGFARKEFSPSEVIEAVIARIAAREPELHALYAYDPEGARVQARAATARWQKGEALGPLDGVPVSIKENLATKGVPMPLGTAASELIPQPVDAPPAARLREAGAVIFAKTTMPDYGMLSSGLSSFHPLTRNPWNLARNPGGSSAGAAAAAAAGYGPLHIGTDIGGSVRLPAGWCGLVGLKPSLGRVPIDPPYIGRAAGPLTRTVADTAVTMAVISRPDWRDHMSLPPADIPWQALGCEVRGLRIGLLREAGVGFAPEPEIAAAIEAAARAFAHAGAIIEEMPPFLTAEMLAGLDTFWRVRAWADISALPAPRQAKVLPFIYAWAEGGARASGLEVYRGVSQIMAIRAAAARAFRDIDFALSPTAPIPAFAAELPAPTNDPARPFEHIAFTVGFNMSEQPAVSINAGYTREGLPIGMQIIGRRFDDIGVLRLAAKWEEMRPAQHPWPIG